MLLFFQGNEYTISFDPMPEGLAQKLSKEDFKDYLHLLEKAQTSPREAFDQVGAFQRSHPDLPELRNLLIFVLLYTRRVAEAEKLIVENYEKHPHYLFAKINFADLCLTKKQHEKIPLIFSSFNLAKIYPEKKIFHFTEFRGFMTLMGLYHLSIKKREVAQTYYEAAIHVDPAHLSVVHLGKKLRRHFFIVEKVKSLLLRH